MNLLPFPISQWLVAASLLSTLYCPALQAASGSLQIASEPRAIPYEQEMEIRRAAKEQKEKEIRLGEKLLQQKLQQQQQQQPGTHNTDQQVDLDRATAPEINRHNPPPYSKPAPPPVRPRLPPPQMDSYAAQLPMVIGDNWILKYNANSGCSLHSSTKLMNDGVGLTSVSLILTSYVWEIKTQSDIEPRHPENGIHLNSGQFVRVENVVDATRAVFPLHSNEITAGLQTASSITVELSFWPSWPMSDAISAQITVEGFPIAYQKWQQCNRHFETR